MLDRLIKTSTDYLIRAHVISEDDRDIYEYGFHALYNNIIDITSIVIISVWLNQVPQTILYHISFVVLRHVAGGFHAKTHLRCFVMSTAIWMLSLWGISCMASPVICIGFAGLSVFLIWTKAPIEHANSPLSAEKFKRMKLLSRVFSAIFFAVMLLLIFVLGEAHLWIAASLAYGMASHAILILATVSQEYFDQKRIQ